MSITYIQLSIPRNDDISIAVYSTFDTLQIGESKIDLFANTLITVIIVIVTAVAVAIGLLNIFIYTKFKYTK